MTYQDRILEISCGILEMAGEGESINVPVDPRIDITALTADDKDPKYVNVETIRVGTSKVNKRRYNNEVVGDIHNLTIGAQGYLGHPDPMKTSFEFREPQGIYVGSTVQEMQDGTKRAVAKMYMFKTSPLREWVPKSIAAGRPLTVSINAVGDVYRDLTSGVIDVKRITRLDSIDWANPGTEGMGTSQAMSVVTEMQGDHNNNGGAGTMPDERQGIVRSVTIAEMRAYNQEAVNAIVSGVTLAELQQNNQALVSTIENGAKITEMKLTVDGAEKMVKLSDVQGVIDAQVTKITEMQGTINTMKITEMKTRLLGEMVPEQYREKVAGRVSGTDEASLKTSIESEVAFIKEIAGASWDNQPKGKSQHVDGHADMETKVKGLFGVKEPDKK
jgi:hypothetical protein